MIYIYSVPIREKSDQKVPLLKEPNSKKMDVFGDLYKIAKRSPVLTYLIIMWVQLDLLA